MFICPNCEHESLDVKQRMDLGRNGDWDEMELQLAKCNDCGLCAVCSYLEERHGSSDYWRHEGIIVAEKTWEKLKAKLNHWCFWRTHKWLDSTGGSIFAVVKEISEDFDPDNVQLFKLKLAKKEYPEFEVKRQWKRSKRPWSGPF